MPQILCLIDCSRTIQDYEKAIQNSMKALIKYFTSSKRRKTVRYFLGKKKRERKDAVYLILYLSDTLNSLWNEKL